MDVLCTLARAHRLQNQQCGPNCGKCPGVFLELHTCYFSSNTTLCLQDIGRILMHLLAVNKHFSFQLFYQMGLSDAHEIKMDVFYYIHFLIIPMD